MTGNGLYQPGGGPDRGGTATSGKLRAGILPKAARKIQPKARRGPRNRSGEVVRQLMSVVHSFGWRSGRCAPPYRKRWNGRKPYQGWGRSM